MREPYIEKSERSSIRFKHRVGFIREFPGATCSVAPGYLYASRTTTVMETTMVNSS